MSKAEDLLEFQIRALGLPAPVREHRFHGERRWRFDLAFVDRKLAVEIEGLTPIRKLTSGKLSAGRHQTIAGMREDCVKYAEALCLGWDVLRVTQDMVRDGRAVGYVERALQAGAP